MALFGLSTLLDSGPYHSIIPARLLGEISIGIMTFSLPSGTGELLKINRQNILRFLLKIRLLQSRP
jgi:hypothetical protein